MPSKDRSAAKRAKPVSTCLRNGGKDGPQVRRDRGRRWSDKAEQRFLDALGASCNVSLSAAECGFSKEALYRRRRDDPAFAARWQAALEQGYVRLEGALIERANNALEGHLPDPDHPIPPMTVKEIIEILKLHRANVQGDPARYPGWRARPRSLDEMRDSILNKLEAIETRRLARLPAKGADAPA